MRTTPYLIQRARFSKFHSDKIGIDSLLDFDYMGSAEFEFGALGKSLKRVRENINEYVRFDHMFADFPEKIVSVYCKHEDMLEIPEILEKLARRENDIRLKEYCDLDVYLKDLQRRGSDFWWDIENDFFFWRNNEEFNVLFIDKLINPNN